jgi:hypothetical protein
MLIFTHVCVNGLCRLEDPQNVFVRNCREHSLHGSASAWSLRLLILAVLSTACGSSESSGNATGAGGSAGRSADGAAGRTGAAGRSGAAGAAGNTGVAGNVSVAAGSGGSSAAGSGGSSVAGSDGSSAAGSGGSSAAGSGGSSAAGSGGSASKYTPFTCPPGPYPKQMQGTSTSICSSNGFKYNYSYNEGPTWIATQNAFFFSNFIEGDNVPNKMSGDIIKVSLAADGSATCEVWLHDVGCNGLGVASDGNLLGACHGPRAVMKYDVVTKQGKALATMAGGQMLDAPNDLISTRNGNIYFSNTTYELGGRPEGLGFALVRIDPTGVISVVQKGLLNGMALSPDEKLLYVVQMGVWNLNPDGSPGTKTNMPGPGGDGISVDCAGDVLIVDTNSAFGGPDGKTLIAVGPNTNAHLIQMTVPGFP